MRKIKTFILILALTISLTLTACGGTRTNCTQLAISGLGSTCEPSK